MPAFASITVNNDAAVAQTFTPQSITEGIAKWVSNDAVLDAKRVITASSSLPSKGGSVARQKVKITLPVMSPTDATLKIAEGYFIGEFVYPKQMSDTQRKDLRAYGANFLDRAEVTTFATSLEGTY